MHRLNPLSANEYPYANHICIPVKLHDKEGLSIKEYIVNIDGFRQFPAKDHNEFPGKGSG
jgi:hypothetical protein